MSKLRIVKDALEAQLAGLEEVSSGTADDEVLDEDTARAELQELQQV